MSRTPSTQDKIIYKVSQDVWETDEFRKLAIKSRLFVPGWFLIDWLSGEHFSGYSNTINVEDDKIILAFYDKIPVGIGTWDSDNGHSMFFVVDGFRGCGIGKKLAEIIKDFPGKKFAIMGIPASKFFFESVGIEMRDNF